MNSLLCGKGGGHYVVPWFSTEGRKPSVPGGRSSEKGGGSRPDGLVKKRKEGQVCSICGFGDTLKKGGGERVEWPRGAGKGGGADKILSTPAGLLKEERETTKTWLTTWRWTDTRQGGKGASLRRAFTPQRKRDVLKGKKLLREKKESWSYLFRPAGEKKRLLTPSWREEEAQTGRKGKKAVRCGAGACTARKKKGKTSCAISGRRHGRSRRKRKFRPRSALHQGQKRGEEGGEPHSPT